MHNNVAFESTHPLSWQHWNYLIKVLGQMDKHKILIDFHIDLSKAFDSLRHDLLICIERYYQLTLVNLVVTCKQQTHL